MSLEPASSAPRRKPLIGLTTYRKRSKDTNSPLYGLMLSYVRAVAGAGGIPLLIPLNVGDEDLPDVLARLDGLLLPGGGDIDPHYYGGQPHDLVAEVDDERDRVELGLARLAVNMETPLLAICRGHQVLNVALGGTMYEDVASQMPGAIRHDYDGERTSLPHTVSLLPGTKLAALLEREETPVNSIHHQGLNALAPELVVSALAPDGLVEGVEVPGHPFAIGVQWHPENLLEVQPVMGNLFTSLVRAARGEA
jgi:putative glutamine amidotransferase